MSTESHSDASNPNLPQEPAPGFADRRALLAGLGGLAAGSLLAGANTAHAGPLSPPPGPVTPTGRTLLEVEPRIPVGPTTTPGDAFFVFRITQSGTYYLTQNVIGTPGRSGILINAPSVTLDLNGFTIEGVANSGSGIRVLPLSSQLRLFNGNISQWGSHGLQFSESTGTLFCESVSFTSNGQAGLNSVSGTVVANLCLAAENGTAGLVASGNGSVVTNCTASENGTDGIVIGFGGSLTNSSAFSNGGFGLRVSSQSTVSGCTVGQNGSGVSLGISAMIDSSAVVSSQSVGVLAPNGNRVSNCVVRENQGIGIDAGVACTITGSTVVSSGIDGIRINRRCLVDRNLIVGNGTQVTNGAGIRTSDAANHIRDNTCYDNDIGIWANSAVNFIESNRCSGNGQNWNVVAGNACFASIASLNPAPFAGNAGGVSWGSTDPRANFTL